MLNWRQSYLAQLQVVVSVPNRKRMMNLGGVALEYVQCGSSSLVELQEHESDQHLSSFT